MRFRLVPKSMTLGDLEQVKGQISSKIVNNSIMSLLSLHKCCIHSLVVYRLTARRSTSLRAYKINLSDDTKKPDSERDRRRPRS